MLVNSKGKAFVESYVLGTNDAQIDGDKRFASYQEAALQMFNGVIGDITGLLQPKDLQRSLL